MAEIQFSDISKLPSVRGALAEALLEKFGGDSLTELRRNVDGYRDAIAKWWP